MMRLEVCCHRCSNQGCRTTVCLDEWPDALHDCGHIVCDACVTCDLCAEVAA